MLFNCFVDDDDGVSNHAQELLKSWAESEQNEEFQIKICVESKERLKKDEADNLSNRHFGEQKLKEIYDQL